MISMGGEMLNRVSLEINKELRRQTKITISSTEARFALGKAAIKAMKKPTADMIDAVLNPTKKIYSFSDWEDWERAIDKALEKPEGK
jgi:hypothetical protein